MEKHKSKSCQELLDSRFFYGRLVVLLPCHVHLEMYFQPVYNGPFVIIRSSVYVLVVVVLFLYTLKRFGSSFFSKAKAISGENDSNLFCMQRKLSDNN